VPDDRAPTPTHIESPTGDRDTVLGRDGWARLVAALTAAAFAVLTIPGSEDFPLDDAWIHLSYAKSVRLGDGLSYNPGDWETGFSSPAWALMLAAWPTGDAPVLPVKLLGVLLHALSAWLAAHIVLDLAKQRASVERPIPALSMALLAGALVASAPALVQGSTSGMEVPLTAAVLLGSTAAMLSGVPLAAGLTGGLAVWCRPESLAFVLVVGGTLAAGRYRLRGEHPKRFRAAWVGPLGALVALGLWVAWCWSVSGYPWPNTQYIKGAGGGLAGLSYLRDEILPSQPWIVSLTGVVLVAIGVVHDVRQRRPELLALLAAVLLTWVAIAVSRPLHPGTGFYETRYFAPFCVGVTVLLPFGVAALLPRPRGRWLAWGAVLPVAITTAFEVAHVRTRLLEQSADTHAVHTLVALGAAKLPPDAVIAVEGAGAIRYFVPRTMTVLDIVGLNDRRAAHLHFDRTAKMCHFVQSAPTHFAIPADWLPQFLPVFAMRPVDRFDDPHYTQVDPPRPHTVVLAAVEAVNPQWTARCAARSGS